MTVWCTSTWRYTLRVALQIHDRSLDQLSPRQLHDIIQLRVDVFVVEQECPYPELDGRDVEPGTRHLWLERDGAVVAVARILDDGDVWRIGRVAAARGSRGLGLAGTLMAAAIERCPGRPIVLSAQSHLTEWYGGFGFTPDGAEYLEDGIPHIPMRRDVEPASAS